MNGPTPEQILFAEARQRATPAERAAYLAEACGGDTALLRRVNALLQAEENAGDFLERPPDGVMNADDPASLLCEISERPGDRIGRYKLLKEIGEGGCGVVYLAEQEEPVRRRVALKIIKLGMETKQVIARFEAERQALAMMDHPNIARVLDAGATSTGRPYFVMELVRGFPLTAFCDQKQFDTRQRLELFGHVCQAIQHAHQKGIIHRDLKPSNVLVADHDGVPVPKVIDFGIAKATTNQPLTDKTFFTALEQFMGTPAYMSPEQASLSGLDIDTRTDIYSLGVLLYELLMGRTPFDARALAQSGIEKMRATIREQEPSPPSTRLRGLPAAELTVAAGHRRIEGLKLIHLLQGDLDWIVMKCLEKDRTRRYQTASGLAMDTQRHLNGDPVLARPPSFGYRTGKWIRKHKGPAVAVTAIALTLCAGLVVSTTLYFRARKAAAGESIQRAKAETESAKSVQTAHFMAEMLSGIDPSYARGRDVSVLIEMLEAAAGRVESELKNQPEVEATVRMTIGHVYRSLALYPKAELHLQKATALRAAILGPDHVETLNGQLELVDLYREQGRSRETRALCAGTLAAAKRTSGPASAQALELQQRLALICADQRDFAEAESLQREAVRLAEERFGPDDIVTLKARGGLGAIYLQERKFSQAEPIHRATLTGLKRLLKPEHPGLLQEMANLAASLHGLGRLPEAQALYRETWELEKRVHGPDHPKSLITMQNLATLQSSLGQHVEAEALLRKAADIARATIGADHPRTLRTLEVLTLVLSRQGKNAEAEALAREILETNKKLSGPENPRTLKLMVNLADVLARGNQKFAEAESIYREVLAIQNRTLGPDHPDTLLTAGNLLALQRRIRNFTAAESFCREMIEMTRRSLGSNHSATAEWEKNLSMVLKESARATP